VSCKGEGPEAVFLNRAASDVVNDQGDALAGVFVADDHYVGSVGGYGAGDEVSGEVVAGLAGDGEGISLSFEVVLQVGDAAMVDIRVRFFELPYGRVFGEGGFHVFMKELL